MSAHFTVKAGQRTGYSEPSVGLEVKKEKAEK
jgi:hypothetical protein